MTAYAPLRSLRRHGLPALLAACVLPAMLCASGEAQAQRKGGKNAQPAAPETIVLGNQLEIVGLGFDDSVEEQANAMTGALRFVATRLPGTTPGTSAATLDLLTLANNCDTVPDATCQAAISQQLKTSQYIWGFVRKVNHAEVRLELHRYIHGQGDHKGEPVNYPLNLRDQNDDALQAVAKRALSNLLNLRTGFVLATSAKAGANCPIYIDDTAAGTLEGGRLLVETTPGPHKVSSGAPCALGFTTVTVPESGEVSVDLDALRNEKSASSAPASRGVSGRRIAAYSLIGAGAASGIAGAVFGGLYLGNRSAGSDDNKRIAPDLTQRYSGDADAMCAAIGANAPGPERGFCDAHSAAKRNSALGIALGAVGGALIVGGVVLLVTEPKQESAPAPKPAQASVRVRFEPQVGRTNGLWLTGEF